MPVDLQYIRKLLGGGAQRLPEEEKWQIAEALWKARYEDRIVVDLIAIRIDRDRGGVARWIRIWEYHEDIQKRGLSFSEAYREAGMKNKRSKHARHDPMGLPPLPPVNTELRPKKC